MKNKKNDQKNKKPIIIVIIAIVVLIIIGLISFFGRSNNSHYSKINYFFEYPQDEIKVLEICKEKNCGLSDDKFHMIALKKEYPGLNDSINEINRNTEKYYNEVKSSDFSAEDCSAAQKKYNYSKYIDVHFENYENDNYISIAVVNTFTDLCKMKSTRDKTNVYIYDKKTQKLLSQEDFISREKVFDEEIRHAIEENNKMLAKEKIDIPENAEYNDTVLYYSSQGYLLVSYNLPGSDTYYQAMVRVPKNN